METNMTAPNNTPTFTHTTDPAYIKAAVAAGFGNKDTLTRAECIVIRTKTGMRLPRWLMKDPARRKDRGTYYCPELLDAAEANANNTAFKENTING